MTTTRLEELDRDELDRKITAMYRDVASGTATGLHFPTGRPLAEALGYSAELLDALPQEAVRSFAGVGHHLDLAELRVGERVLDLGSGSGMDAFAAAVKVGTRGAVVGVDITPEQLANARRLSPGGHVGFVESRIERLPFPGASFDVVISNGVVNLSPDKRAVFAEAARVLRRGGRLALSDIVTERPIALRTAAQPDLWAACIAGAGQRDTYLDDLAAAGLRLEAIRENSYDFASDRARKTSEKYGAHSISLLAIKA